MFRQQYEKQNEILDTLREVDVILDSRFPAEVMRRFSAIDERSEEIEQNTEEDEALEFQAEVDRRGSLTSRAAQALQWISGQASGSSKRTRETNGNDESDIEESAALVGNKRSGTPVGSTTPANSYGAIGEDEETASTRKGRRSPTQQRMALLAAVPGKGEREEESSRAINFAINGECGAGTSCTLQSDWGLSLPVKGAQAVDWRICVRIANHICAFVALQSTLRSTCSSWAAKV